MLHVILTVHNRHIPSPHQMQVADFHCPHRTCQDAGLCFEAPEEEEEDHPATPPPPLSEGKEFVARVGESFAPRLEGYWERREGGAGAGGCNPFAGAVLVVEDGAGAGTKRKVTLCGFVGAVCLLGQGCVFLCLCSVFSAS